MKLFDLHCDTLPEAYEQGKGLFDNGLHFDLARCHAFTSVGQVLAVYSTHEKTPAACYAQFDAVMDAYDRLQKTLPPFFTPVIGVEGGKLLEGELARVDHLYDRGVRVLTLVWGERSCMGGAFEFEEGLTPFGFQVVNRLFALGILPDVSHASLAMTEQTVALAEKEKKPILASHSCFSALCPHRRNLTDDHAVRIASLGGVIGVNLVRAHLTPHPENCDIDTVIDHILYGVNLCGREGIGLGCDLDGTAHLPDGIRHVGDLARLYERLADRAGSFALADAVFYDNVHYLLKSTVL